MQKSLDLESGRRVFYHGTPFKYASKIAAAGFRVWTLEEPPYFWNEAPLWIPSGGSLGHGIYITTDWRTAMYFGNTLLQVRLSKGVRILDAALPPDERVLGYLRREFGREVLVGEPDKVLPRNKQLTLEELVALVRYHYKETYGREEKSPGVWRRARERHWAVLNRLRRHLMRYGLHGFGNPRDEIGLVMFAGDWLELQDVLVEVPQATWELADYHKQDFRQYPSLDAFLKAFPGRGTTRARRLARSLEPRNPTT